DEVALTVHGPADGVADERGRVQPPHRALHDRARVGDGGAVLTACHVLPRAAVPALLLVGVRAPHVEPDRVAGGGADRVRLRPRRHSERPGRHRQGEVLERLRKVRGLVIAGNVPAVSISHRQAPSLTESGPITARRTSGSPPADAYCDASSPTFTGVSYKICLRLISAVTRPRRLMSSSRESTVRSRSCGITGLRE